jgi:hypothetical protein
MLAPDHVTEGTVITADVPLERTPCVIRVPVFPWKYALTGASRYDPEVFFGRALYCAIKVSGGVFDLDDAIATSVNRRSAVPRAKNKFVPSLCAQNKLVPSLCRGGRRR